MQTPSMGTLAKEKHLYPPTQITTQWRVFSSYLVGPLGCADTDDPSISLMVSVFLFI